MKPYQGGQELWYATGMSEYCLYSEQKLQFARLSLAYAFNPHGVLYRLLIPLTTIMHKRGTATVGIMPPIPIHLEQEKSFWL